MMATLISGTGGCTPSRASSTAWQGTRVLKICRRAEEMLKARSEADPTTSRRRRRQRSLPSSTMAADASGPLRVHALISSLTWGGAEMLLSEFAAGAPSAGIELSVGYLEDRDGSPGAARLVQRGVEPVLAPI